MKGPDTAPPGDRPPPRSAAPEFGRIAGPLAPAAGQVGSLAEQMAKAHTPRPTGRADRPLSRAEVEDFVRAAVASALAARSGRGAA